MKNISQREQKKQPKVRTVKTAMTGKGLTIHAGLLPVMNFMNKLGFWNKVKNEVHAERAPNARYQFSDAVEMIVTGLMTGATAMEHIATVWSDEVLLRIRGWETTPAATTLGRIMKLAGHANITELESLVHSFRGRVWKRAVRSGQRLQSALSCMWVDIDSTVDGVCGVQEGAQKGYNPKKKGQKAYHPLMAFAAETREVLHSWFRCGSAYTSNGVVAFMKECLARIGKGVKVIVRADSGFFSGAFLSYLEAKGAGYLIKVKMKNLARLLSQQAWTAIPDHPGWEQTIFQYRCTDWSCARTFVAVRQLIRIEKGLFELPVYDSFCYVTTEAFSPLEVHRRYGERATCETWIEECKSQMHAGTIRTSQFLANAALFQCAVLAYNILRWMALLTGGLVRHWEVKTIRLWLIRVAGKLTGGHRQLVLKLPKTFLHQAEWNVWERMSATVSF